MPKTPQASFRGAEGDEESTVPWGISEKQIPRSAKGTGAQKARFASLLAGRQTGSKQAAAGRLGMTPQDDLQALCGYQNEAHRSEL